MSPAVYLLHRGKTMPVVAMVKQNNVPMLAIMDGARVVLVPTAQAVRAPIRTKPTLATIDGERVDEALR